MCGKEKGGGFPLRIAQGSFFWDGSSSAPDSADTSCPKPAVLEGRHELLKLRARLCVGEVSSCNSVWQEERSLLVPPWEEPSALFRCPPPPPQHLDRAGGGQRDPFAIGARGWVIRGSVFPSTE